MSTTKVDFQVVQYPSIHIAMRVYNDPSEHGKVKRFSIDRFAEFLAEAEDAFNTAVRWRHVKETEPELKGMSTRDIK